MKKRLIFLLVSWAAVLVPGIVASEFARSYAKKFVSGLGGLKSIDQLSLDSKGKVDEASDRLRDKADKIGLGGAVDKLSGAAKDKVDETADKAAETGAQKISEQVAALASFCMIPFPGFQFKLLGLFPCLSVILFSGLGVLSFGFLYCGRPHADVEG